MLRNKFLYLTAIHILVVQCAEHKSDLYKKIDLLNQQIASQQREISRLKERGQRSIMLSLCHLQHDYLIDTFERIPGTLNDNSGQKVIISKERGLTAPRATEPFKTIYKKNNMSRLASSSAYRIPPIIHQIWVGPHSKERFEKLRKTFFEKHPGWLYKLWTDEDVKKLLLVNQKSYEAATNYAFKADILRYELLYIFGGVYVDMDCTCIQSLDILNQNYEFYVGLLDSHLVGNSVIGSSPQHPILRHCIETINERTGPEQLTSSFKSVAPLCSGPVIALPVDYFYPYPKQSLYKDFKGDIKLEAKEKLPETFIVHGGAGTWTPGGI